MMAMTDPGSIFTLDAIKRIGDSLPKGFNVERRKLLPKVLQGWERSDLSEHLSRDLDARRDVTRMRLKSLETVAEQADALLKSLNALDEHCRFTIARKIVGERSNLSSIVSLAELECANRHFEESLSTLATAARSGKRKAGRPRNVVSYLVMMDLAAIFEWLTDKKAARGVDNARSRETGHFYRFAAAVWPIVFLKGCEGLPAAIKIWAHARKNYNEESAVIVHLAWEHPKWGLLRRQRTK